MTSSADFDLIGVAIKYEECRSIQVKIHLNPLLIRSNGPTQSKHNHRTVCAELANVYFHT